MSRFEHGCERCGEIDSNPTCFVCSNEEEEAPVYFCGCCLKRTTEEELDEENNCAECAKP